MLVGIVLDHLVLSQHVRGGGAGGRQVAPGCGGRVADALLLLEHIRGHRLRLGGPVVIGEVPRAVGELVERDLAGGECSYWACMPSKALLRPGEVLAAARCVPAAAPAVTGGVDVAATLRSRDAFTTHWVDGRQVDWLEGTGTTLVRGHARLHGPLTIDVTVADGTTRTLRARRKWSSPRASAAIPPVEGLRDLESWNNRDVTRVGVACSP